MTPEEWLDKKLYDLDTLGPFLAEALEELLEDHSPYYPASRVPKDEATRLKFINAKGQDILDIMCDSDLWKSERSAFKECKTCPDIAGWPCPTRARIAEFLGVDPE